MKPSENFANAVGKYNALVENDSSVADLPLLVAFFFDQLAEFLSFHRLSFEKRDERFPEVSGILTIKEDVVMPTDFKNLSHEQQGRYLESSHQRMTCHTPKTLFCFKTKQPFGKSHRILNASVSPSPSPRLPAVAPACGERKLVAEWQQRGPETLSGRMLRKLRLAFAPSQSAKLATVNR
jgi:hypothetical protein